MRVHELSKKLNKKNRDVLDSLPGLGINVTSHLSRIDEKTARIITEFFSGERHARASEKTFKSTAKSKKPSPHKQKNSSRKTIKNKSPEETSKRSGRRVEIKPVITIQKEEVTSERKKIVDPHAEQAVENLLQIRSFSGHPVRFWPAFLHYASILAGARTGILLVRSKDDRTWKKTSIWPAKENTLLQSTEMDPMLADVAESSYLKRCAWKHRATNGTKGVDCHILGIRLELDNDNKDHCAVFILDEMHAVNMEETAKRVRLVADTPAIYQRNRAANQEMKNAARFSQVLDLMVLLNTEIKYMPAVMTFVNEVASRYACPRVSLGWIDDGYVRLQAVSHMEKFEQKMDIVQTLEAAMEEAFDQDEEVLWPVKGDGSAVVRDHDIYAKAQGVKNMVSIPVRLDNEPVGVLTCERREPPFSEADVLDLRLLCDQAVTRLGDLKDKDRWFGARILSRVRTGAAKLIGVKHTLAKCTGLIVCGLLMLLLFGQLTYRIEAPFNLRSDDVRYLPTPFNGYIEAVNVRPGEHVEKGQLLLSLDTTELLLEESSAIANHIRYSRETEKTRSKNELAEMKIAMAMADQAKAKLNLVRHNLSRADIIAPFSGIVVEGDLNELKGISVNKGDVLLKISRLEKMYAELEVGESDIHETAEGDTGEIVFVSQPNIKYPFIIEKINPVANADSEKGNVFLVRCLFPDGMSDWWRPGMSGVAKIHIGKRNILWMLTHRTLDFFRIHLWW